MLTSSQREILRDVRTVIIDEVHAMAATKRGAHLALSLERLSAICHEEPQRVALSATQRPLEEVARFVGGDRPVTIVDAGVRKELDLEVRVPVEDLADLGYRPESGPSLPSPLADVQGATDGGARSIWPAIYPELLELVRTHRSTLIFVNSRRLAERLALRLNELAEAPVARAHHGSLSREARSEIEEALKAGELPASSPPRRSSSASTWARSTWSARSSRPARSPAACSASAEPAIRWASRRAGASSPSSAETCWSAPSSQGAWSSG